MQRDGIPARLILDDGTCFQGWSFGKACHAVGEVVFTTGMTGYPQYLTDPSFRGQILVSTFPLVGNYGIPAMVKDSYGIPVHFESDHIQVAGFIIGEACEAPSHFSSSVTLSEWMNVNGIPGIQGIDTRALTKILRNRGVMNGRIHIDCEISQEREHENQVAGYGVVHSGMHIEPTVLQASIQNHPVSEASPTVVRVLLPNDTTERTPTVVLVDCGAKANILRCLLVRGVKVIQVPWNHELEGLEYDGIFLSNGPGDPKACGKTIATVRRSLRGTKPIFGICLGNQILALAAGADTFKLPYGHRGQNQPCVEVGTKRCYITSQNHGYAVRGNTLPAGWESWFLNGNDGTIEGIRSTDGRFCAVQFHPEGCPGPRDTEFLIDRFIDLVKRSRT